MRRTRGSTAAISGRAKASSKAASRGSKELRKRHRKKVSLVGWSLGGLYARELAKLAPKDVRLVITLGTPFTGHPKATNAWRLYELVAGHKIGAPEIHEPLRAPPPVPTTSIYSRTDGIVAWQCCVEKEGPRAENIEVEASHFGHGIEPCGPVRDRGSSGPACRQMAAVRSQRRGPRMGLSRPAPPRLVLTARRGGRRRA